MQSNTQASAFKAQGRISRITYLAWNMALMLVLLVVVAFIIMLFPSLEGFDPETMLFPDNIGLWVIFFLILYIPIIYMSIIWSVKRLHDVEQTGWLVLLNFVPFLNFLFAIYVVFAAGTEGPNKFGPQRAPKTWEKVIAWLTLGLLGLGILLAILAALI